jgi:hypothetical protein
MLLNNGKKTTENDFVLDENFEGVTPVDESQVLLEVMEADENLNEYTMALIKAEHESFVNENSELLAEATAEWIEKVKEWFAKVWKAFKSFMAWVWGEIKSVFMKKSAWVKKYEKEIKAGAEKADKAKKELIWTLKSAADFMKEDLAPQEDVTAEDVTKIQNTFSDMFSGKTRTTYGAKVGMAVEFVKAFDTKKIKKIFESGQKSIKKAEEKAIKAAGKENSDEIEKAKKSARNSMKVLQIAYSGLKKLNSFYYAFCHKCYTYNTFGSSKPKKTNENASILDQYK